MDTLGFYECTWFLAPSREPGSALEKRDNPLRSRANVASAEKHLLLPLIGTTKEDRNFHGYLHFIHRYSSQSPVSLLHSQNVRNEYLKFPSWSTRYDRFSLGLKKRARSIRAAKDVEREIWKLDSPFFSSSDEDVRKNSSSRFETVERLHDLCEFSISDKPGEGDNERNWRREGSFNRFRGFRGACRDITRLMTPAWITRPLFTTFPPPPPPRITRNGSFFREFASY